MHARSAAGLGKDREIEENQEEKNSGSFHPFTNDILSSK